MEKLLLRQFFVPFVKWSFVCILITILCDIILEVDSDETAKLLLWRTKKSNSTCSQNQFRCSNGNCINQKNVCDGFFNCGTKIDDESWETCHKNKACSKNQFRCNTGSCIHINKVCDGNKNCIENEDEAKNLCAYQNLNSMSSCSTDEFRCEDGSCISNALKCDGKKHCADGSDEKQELCPLPKICKKLQPVGMDLKCKRNLKGKEVRCNSTFPEGTIVRPTCTSHYHAEYVVNYTHIICQSDGTWNRELFRCVPDCGRTMNKLSATHTIAHGTAAITGEAPWNVAVYFAPNTSNTPQFICGGTLVSSQLILSAAHCFFGEYDQPQNASDFEVAIGKMTKEYKSVIRNGYPKFYRVQKIYFNTDVTYTGSETHYAGDIALLKIPKIRFDSVVLPACLQWASTFRFNPGSNIQGKLAGFGDDERGNPSNQLMIGYMPFISYAQCRDVVHEDFKNDISIDKFCAGKYQGAGARSGDSGGGLVFQNSSTGLYYVRGIVSNRDATPGRNSSSISTFTDISQYLDWIKNVLKEVEKVN